MEGHVAKCQYLKAKDGSQTETLVELQQKAVLL